MQIQQWRQEVASEFAILNRTPAERLTFVTIVLDARVVRLNKAAPNVNDIIAAFAPDLRATLDRSGNIGRNLTRWVFAPELDLLHPMMIGGKGSKGGKRRLLAELGVDLDTIAPDERVAITHVHGLIDHRGHPSRGAVMSDLRIQWPGYRRVHGDKLHADKTVAANLRELSGYCTKMRLRYGNAWEGGQTTFGPRFEPEWRSWVRAVYDGLAAENWLISSLTAQAAECIAPPAQTVAAQGFREDGDQLQLTVAQKPPKKDITDIIKEIRAKKTTP